MEFQIAILVLVAAGLFLLLFKFPWMGLVLVLTVPIVKGYLRGYFPFLVSFTYDMSAMIYAYLGIIINYYQTRYEPRHFASWGKTSISVFYTMLVLCIMSYTLSRSGYIAYKKFLIFAIHVHMAVWLPILYMRTEKNVRQFINTVLGIGLFCTVALFLFPIQREAEGYGRLSVFGANPLAPTFFAASAIIILWSGVMNKTAKRWMMWAIPLIFIGIVATGQRAPVIFAVFVVLAMTFRSGGWQSVKGAIWLLLSAVIIIILFSVFQEFLASGIGRFQALKVSAEESRIKVPMMVLQDWLQRPGAWLLGGGIGDTHFVIARGNPDSLGYPHNWLIEALVELGPVGFVAVGWLLLAVLRRCWSLKKNLAYYPLSMHPMLWALGGIALMSWLDTFKTGSWGGSYTRWIMFSAFLHVTTRWKWQPANQPAYLSSDTHELADGLAYHPSQPAIHTGSWDTTG